MNRPDFRQFKHSKILVHSAKGSEWEEHKYVKRVNGTYYYPNDYEGGRHISDLGENDKSESKKTSENSEDKKKKDSETLSKIADFTGMKESAIQELMTIARTKGYDSKEYKDLANDLAEGDQEQYKKISDALKENDSGETIKYSDKDFDALAQEVVKGNFGNGQQRKDLLGENYGEIQKRVNEIMKKSGSKKVSEVKDSDTAKTGTQAIKKASSLSVSKSKSSPKSPDATRYLSVYERQALRKRK